MTDYTKATGSSGTMMIRDTGTTVEFWLKAGSATHNANLPWRFNVGSGVSAVQYFDFNTGGAWQKLKSWSVTTSRTVTFYLLDSGTSGLGGPTTFSIVINRDSAPPAPDIRITGFTSTTVTVNSDSNGDGGSTILQWRIGYGTSSTAPTTYVNANEFGNATITGLTPGTTYYFWAQLRNAFGWGARSVRVSAKTWGIPAAPSTPVLTNIKQSSLTATFTPNANGGTIILEKQIGYGTSPTGAPTTLVTSTGSSNLTNIPGGVTLYFRARVRNSVGWSPWSGAASVKLRAGAWVTVVTTTSTVNPLTGLLSTTTRVSQRPAVVYVKVAGEWRVATPMVRIAGLWKETG